MVPGDVAWREVLPPEPVGESAREALRKTDALRELWIEKLQTASTEEIELSRKSGLRRHAIETGIIERLYDVDWGVTQGVTLALIADGLTMEVVSREGGLSEDTLDTIRVQFDALEFLSEYAKEGRDLSVLRLLHEKTAPSSSGTRAGSSFWYRQIERSAREVGFFANLSDGA